MKTKTLNKQEVVKRLQGYCERYDSQNKAANSLKGVSSATISQMLNGKWELIKEDMWRNVASQIGCTAGVWQLVETTDFKMLNSLLSDAQENSLVFAVTGAAGSGKTFALRHYVETNKRVYLLQCNEFWNRKMFLQELLSAMGKDHSGWTVSEMVQAVVSGLKTQEQPLIIMDEADKLCDQVIYFFITLYNYLEDHCGIVLCATSHLKKRIERGVKSNKKGYSEIYSRIGRKFIELRGIGSKDIATICEANGINDANLIKEVVQESECDLRRVKRKIHAIKKRAA